MNLKSIHIKEDIKEKDFTKTIKRYGYRGIKFLKRNERIIKEIILKISPNFFEESCDEFEYTQLGKPDFFIWNYKIKQFYFCEFKSKTDFLPTHQLNWFHLNHTLPGAIAFVSIPSLNEEFFFEEVNMISCIREWIILKYWKMKCPDDNLDLRPTLISYNPVRTMYRYNGAWVGTFPHELSDLLIKKGVPL